ncbi:MAG: transposase, partial [Thermoleophilaceae bacterium]
MGVGENPRESLSELAKLGARLIIQRAVEEEFDAWLGRARYERRPDDQRGLRNGFRPRKLQTAEGELSVELPQVREWAEPFVSKLFPRGTMLLRTEPLRAMVSARSCVAVDARPRVTLRAGRTGVGVVRIACMAAVGGTAGIGSAIGELADGVRDATDEAQALGLGDKQLALSALARLSSQAADALTSSPAGHAAPETADVSNLASALNRQNVLRSDSLFVAVVKQLLPHISLTAGALVAAGVLYNLGKSVGEATFLALAAVLAAGSGALLVAIARAAAALGPALGQQGEAVARGFAELFNAPAAVKSVLAKHVDLPERALYGTLGRTPPFRLINAIGPIGGTVVLLAVGVMLVGGIAGF